MLIKFKCEQNLICKQITAVVQLWFWNVNKYDCQ